MSKVLRAVGEMTLTASIALGTFGAVIATMTGYPWYDPAALAAAAILAAMAWAKWFGGAR